MFLSSITCLLAAMRTPKASRHAEQLEGKKFEYKGYKGLRKLVEETVVEDTVGFSGCSWELYVKETVSRFR